VRDPALRKKLQAVRESVSGEGKKPDIKALAAALTAFAEAEAASDATRTGHPRNPIRHVRVLKPEASNVVIADRLTGAEYKALVPGQNWCMDIVSVPDGKGGYVWKGFAASIFEVNRKDWRPQWERDKIGGKLVMRLHKGDMMEIDDSDGVRRVKRVVQLEPSANRVRLAKHYEGGKLQERNDTDNSIDGFRWDLATISKMKDRDAKKLKYDEAGYILKLGH
jgi:CRISPR-associated endonuclease Csn1